MLAVTHGEHNGDNDEYGDDEEGYDFDADVHDCHTTKGGFHLPIITRQYHALRQKVL